MKCFDRTKAQKYHNVHILCFSEKQGCSQLFYSEMCIACQNVCFCFGPPTANLPNSISTARVGSWRKTAYCSYRSQLGQRSQILPNLKTLGIHLNSSMTRGIFKQLINVKSEACHFPYSIALLRVLNLAIWPFWLGLESDRLAIIQNTLATA